MFISLWLSARSFWREPITINSVFATLKLSLLAFSQQLRFSSSELVFCSRSAREEPEEVECKWILQLADAIQFLHSKDLVHRDLKPENVLLTATDDIKIGDFGLAREFTSLKETKIAQGTVTTSYVTCYMNTFAGTPHWMAPEVFPGRQGHGHYNEKADVFSLGILFLAILKRDFIINDKGKRLYGAFVNIYGIGKVGIGLAMHIQDRAVAVSLRSPSLWAPVSLQAGGSNILQMIALDALKFEQKDRPTAFEILNRITSFISSVLCSQFSAQPPVSGPQFSAQQPVLGPQFSAQPPVLGPQFSAQQPVLGPQFSAQSPVLGPQFPAQPPVLGPQFSAQQPVLGPQFSAQPPVLGPQFSAQPAVLGPQFSAQPPVLGPQVPFQPLVLGPQVPTQPLILGPRVPAQPLILGPQVPTHPLVLGPQVPVQPLVLGPQVSAQPPVLCSQAPTQFPAVLSTHVPFQSPALCTQVPTLGIVY